MVTTFSARLLSLANRCNPIVGGDKIQKSDAVSNFTNSNTADSAAANQQTTAQPSNNNKNNIKMQGGGSHNNSSYYYAYTHPNDATSSSNKRRRQKEEELQYTAATIQSALEDAGRPPMSILTRERRECALPFLNNSVDMTTAKVVTSREFDDDGSSSNKSTQSSSEEKKNEYDSLDVSTDIIGRPRNRATAAASSYGYDDVASMYMMGSLVQSTRHYYNFSDNDDDENTDASCTLVTSNVPTKKRARYTYSSSSTGILPSKTSMNHSNEDSIIKKAMRTCAQYNDDNDEKLSEDNSEGQSSWAPSTRPCGELADNDKKNIDNDNRSDGQSSGLVGAEESPMSSSDSISSRSSSEDISAMNMKELNNENNAFASIIG